MFFVEREIIHHGSLCSSYNKNERSNSTKVELYPKVIQSVMTSHIDKW